LLNLCIHLLCRQMESLAKAFEVEGGFTERLYRMRNNKRKENP
ncbi:MAG: four helix bundle protein, partial [Candidatus Hydrogenedens sp.]|nr:four helix bundle protein [Candidatus Hydrogenedens sp.]